MKSLTVFIPLIISVTFISVSKVSALETISPNNLSKQKGAYYSGVYNNLFTELLGKSQSEVQTKLNEMWNQLFYGNDDTQRLYYPVEPDMSYIKDIYHNDVRSEGMSYGMMIAVQLDKKSEFDRLWKWAKTYMQHKNEPRKNYFAWQLQTDGVIISPNSATDGEEWFVMALFFASARWENGTGIYNYRAETQAILDTMLNKSKNPHSDTTITNIFNEREKQIVFVPIGSADNFTDPSYHVPHFYELWARWADKNNRFWHEAAEVSRQFLKKAAHPKTGLTPDYAHFDGKPFDPFGEGKDNFQHDAWRVAMNVAVDYVWFAKNSWAINQSNRLLDFFYGEGIKNYGDLYTLNGKKSSDNHSAGLVAMNAVASLASTNKNRADFVKELWDMPIPSGVGCYYDGLLYMLAMLQVSGNFKIYDPTGKPVPACSNDK